MDDPATSESAATNFEPLSRHERRVIGALVEKAKTTPQQYPLSLNSLVTGCNQKSNRSPVMELDEEQVDNAVERLRSLGACVEVNADSRTPRFRHTMYEWLGIDKKEMAVMAELLLRGEQTVGELRGRAARMDPIDGMAALRPILASLAARRLIIYLTPPGRGCIVTHNLYQPSELQKLRDQHGTPEGGYGGDADAVPQRSEPLVAAPSEATRSTPPSTPSIPASTSSLTVEAPRDDHNDELQAVRDEVRALASELAEVRADLQRGLGELRDGLDDLRRQVTGM